MTLTKLAARIRATKPHIRLYLSRRIGMLLVVGFWPNTYDKAPPACSDWQPLKALQDWSVS